MPHDPDEQAARAEDVDAELREREKLVMLGKLSAGLAHELKNPAAAGRRAAGELREAIGRLQELALERFPPAERRLIAELEREVREARGRRGAAGADPLAESDREEELLEWLEARGVEDAWQVAPTLACAGLGREGLAAIAARLEGDALTGALAWIEAAVEAANLVDEVEQSAARISDLVHAVKEHAFMDRAPQQEIDLHEGLESTLKLLHHKLKGGVVVARDYDRSLPRVPAHGSELNQVWTNLIDNAVDAMDGRGRLAVRTRRDGEEAVIEVVDDGPGIPPEIRERIFEAFFTTKGQGMGSGLGLDIVRRIVEARHQGEIRVESKPGETRFEVRLPIGGADLTPGPSPTLPPGPSGEG